MDFAGTTRVCAKIQGYWDTMQVSLHPMVIFYNSSEMEGMLLCCKNLKEKAISKVGVALRNFGGDMSFNWLPFKHESAKTDTFWDYSFYILYI